MNNVTTQRGFSLLGFLIQGFLFVVVLTVGVRLFPVYLENYKIMSSLEKIAENPMNPAAGEMRLSIVDQAQRYFDIEGIKNISARNLIVRPEKEGLILQAKYQVEVELITNIHLLIYFDKQVTVPRHVT